MKKKEKEDATEQVILNKGAATRRVEKEEPGDYGRRMMAYKVRMAANKR